jgi:tetratricopeptide (TPR) repeat protein
MVATMISEPDDPLASGRLAGREGRPHEAARSFREAADLARMRGDAAMLAEALTGLGKSERDLGHSGAAVERYEAATAVLRTLARPLTLAHVLRHVGDIRVDRGELDAAWPPYEEALAIYRAHPSPRLELANALRGYAVLHELTGRTEPARELWREARGLYEAEQVRPGVDEADRRLATLS